MWNKVEDVLLQSYRAAIMQPAVNRYGAPNNHHDRCEIKRVKCHPSHCAAAVHYIQRNAKDVSTIATLAFQLKVNPAEHQRKSNQRRDDAAPHDQLMH